MSRTPDGPVADVLLLAAVERAQLHRARRVVDGVLWRDVVMHLGFDHGQWTTRRLGPQRDALVAAGLLSCPFQHGLVLWALTEAGRQRLIQDRRAGEVVELPESPQHQEWHDAREAAADLIGELTERVRRDLAEAGELLAGGGVCSDAWFEIGERLRRACRALGSATYCLREWVEPDDEHADIDDRNSPGDDQLEPEERGHRRVLRQGRRNTRAWSDTDPGDDSTEGRSA